MHERWKDLGGGYEWSSSSFHHDDESSKRATGKRNFPITALWVIAPEEIMLCGAFYPRDMGLGGGHGR